MNILDKFIAWLMSWVNVAIYVWGGQGETITSTSQIYHMETSKVNAIRAIALWIKRGRRAVCFDCSGIIVKWLLGANLIQYDTTASGLMSMCIKIKKSDLKRGDWVFRVRDGKAYHVGVVVDAELHVVESMGRDDGVVKRGLNEHSIVGYWTDFGRPRIFQDEIEYVAAAHACPYTEPTTDYEHNKYFSGNDAGWFQWQLDRIGHNLKIDEDAKSLTWESINWERQCARLRPGGADTAIRDYLKSLPSQ